MLIESLESRVFLSVTAVNSQILADRLQIKADLLKFNADIKSSAATMIADANAIKADDPASATTILPLVQTLKADVATMRKQLKVDRLTQSAAVKLDQAAIITDRLKFIADKGNPEARQADLASIFADRIKLQNDEIAGLNARLATRQSFDATLATDMNNILTAAQNDPNASDELKADIAKLIADRTARFSVIEADLAQISADRAQLVADLTALQDQPLIA